MRESITIPFCDVDAYNIVHNVNYFRYFDRGRFMLVDRFLRRERPPEIGRYLFLVLKTACKYQVPAFLGDELLLETSFTCDLEQVSSQVNLDHQLFHSAKGSPICRGTTTLGICDRAYRLVYRMPEDVKQYLAEQVAYYRARTTPSVSVH